MKLIRNLAVVLALLFAPSLSAQRAGSWEFGVTSGALYVDGHLRTVLSSSGFKQTGQRLLPTFGGHIGANISDHVGISAGAMWSSQMWWTWKGDIGGVKTGVRYLSPFINATWTPWMAGFSPFFTGGAHVTRITNPWGYSGRVTHSTWGANAGGGARIMLGDHMAMKATALLHAEHYADPDKVDGRRTMYSPSATLGLSYFTHGRKTKVDTVQVVRTVAKIVVDTMWRTSVVIKDTLILEGVNFDFDKSELTADSKEILNKIAAELWNTKWAAVRWTVAGYASTPGTNEYNAALSLRRAQAVIDYLSSRGLAGRFTARGYGEENPKYIDNWRNQRVELQRQN